MLGFLTANSHRGRYGKSPQNQVPDISWQAPKRCCAMQLKQSCYTQFCIFFAPSYYT